MSCNSKKSIVAKLGTTLKDRIDFILNNAILKKEARTSKFVQRTSSSLSGEEFIRALLHSSIHPSATPLSGLCDLISDFKPGTNITVSALRQRVASSTSHDYLKQIFQHVLSVHLEKPLDKIWSITNGNNRGALLFFPRVFLEDSTEAELNPKLADEFKGSGGGCSKACVKIDLIYELKSKTIFSLQIADRRSPDQTLGKKIMEHIREGDLILRDLGYFDTKIFKVIVTTKAFFLTRLHGSCNVFLNEADEEELEIGIFLDKLYKKHGCIDCNLFLSKKKIPCRLVAYPVPENVYNKRMREYKMRCNKGRKRQPTKEMAARLKYTILLTNVPKEVWSYEVVGTVYTARWQIELIFKNWKSQLKVHHLIGSSPNRILTLIYAKLIVILLINTIYVFIDRYVSHYLKGEVSMHKLINWLIRNGRITQIIRSGFKIRHWRLLVKHTQHNLITKETNGRKRKSTLQLLDEQASYLSIYTQGSNMEGFNAS